MRKVLLFLVVSFIVMGTLGAHAIIPDSATVEIPTPESDYSQDTDVQSENFAESEPVVVESSVDEGTEQAGDELPVVDSETVEEMVSEPFNVVDVETETVIMETAVNEDSEQVTDELAIVDSEQVEETAVVEPEVSAEPEQVVVESVMDEITDLSADEVSVVDSEAFEKMVAEPFNDVEVEPEPVVVETIIDEDPEQATDEVFVVEDSEQIEETAVVETFNNVDVELESSVEPEVSAEPEQVVVEPVMDEITELSADKVSVVDSEAFEKMVAEPFNDVEVEPEPVVVETIIDEDPEQATDEVFVVEDSEQIEETAVVETFNNVDVELESSVEPEVSAEPEQVVVEPVMDEITELSADKVSVVDSEASEEMVAKSFNDVDVDPDPVVVDPLVDEVAEQPEDELAVVDPEQVEPLLIEIEDVAEDEKSEQTPYIEDMEDVEENVAETEVPEPVDADTEPVVDDIEDVQTVMDIVPDDTGDNDMESVDVQAEEDEPLVESDESDKKSGINGKVLLSMEATHFAWNFSSNGGGYGLALPCSGVSAEWLFSNRFACGFDVRVSTEPDGTSYRTNLGILNRFGMLSDMKNILNEANVVFFKGDVLLGLTIKDAVGGIATLPTIGLGGSVHFGRDFLTMAFGVDGMVMFPVSGADRTPVFSIRPNMALTWIL